MSESQPQRHGAVAIRPLTVTEPFDPDAPMTCEARVPHICGDRAVAVGSNGDGVIYVCSVHVHRVINWRWLPGHLERPGTDEPLTLKRPANARSLKRPADPKRR